MRISQETRDDSLIFRLEGELDASSAIDLDNIMNDKIVAQYRRVAIDFTELSYIASAGIGVFISNLHRFQETGTAMILFGMQERVYTVFEILGLDALMTIVGTQDEALAQPLPNA